MLGTGEKLDLAACKELVFGIGELFANLSGPWYEVIILKQREVDAVARPLSRMVARKPILHKIIRTYTDPFLFAGNSAAIVRRRYIDVNLIRTGRASMPVDELAQARNRRAAENVQRPDLTVDAAQQATGAPSVTAPPSQTYPQEHAPNQNAFRKHEPHVEPDLAGAMTQLQESSF